MPAQIGRSVKRVEDQRLITGKGQYAGDIRLDGIVHAGFLRSSDAKARIVALNVDRARAMPGVLAVWTAADLPEPAHRMKDSMPDDVPAQLGRPLLAEGMVRYVGEAIAMLIAESPSQVVDAIEAIDLELESQPPVTTLTEAAAPDAPLVHEGLDSNLARRVVLGHGDVAKAFSGNPVIARERLTAGRICGAAMEPRVVTARREGDTLTIWTSTQAVFQVRDELARQLDVEKSRVIVRAPDVGGGFGPKAAVYPEEVMVAMAAWHLGRPIRWVATRSEDTATTLQAHGSILDLELAADPDGKIRGLRGTLLHDAGAYPGPGAAQPGTIVAHMLSAYVLPALEIEGKAYYTNTAPTTFIRGGGRPLGNYAMERMMDRLADRLGLDPVEVRRRNYIQPDQFPYDTGFPGVVYDSGDYPKLLALVLERLGEELPPPSPSPASGGRESRPASAASGVEKPGRLRGVGIVSAVERTGFNSRGEPARVRMDRDGTVHLFVGSTPEGQGHQTMAAQVLADRLGWPIDQIEVTASDTSALDVSTGFYTASSRSALHVGNAVAEAGRATRTKLLAHAAELLEANPSDLVLEDGVIRVRGVPHRTIAATEAIPASGLDVAASFEGSPLAFASGCHAAVVEVDPETGAIEVVRYIVAYESGRHINPMMVEGQLQGGVVHGLGYALYEEAVYAPSGALLTSTLLDYLIPGSTEVPGRLELIQLDLQTRANPEGIKGVGESGTIPAPAAIASAVEHALRRVRADARVTHVPITPQRVFELLRREQLAEPVHEQHGPGDGERHRTQP